MNEALSRWEQYIHHEEQDRLVQMAVIHARFEIIHTFSDGNGRLGRTIIPIVLYRYQLMILRLFWVRRELWATRAILFDDAFPSSFHVRASILLVV